LSRKGLIGCVFVEITPSFYEGTKQTEERKKDRKKKERRKAEIV